MNGSTVMRASRAVHGPDLALLAGIVDQHRRARVDQIEALQCRLSESAPVRREQALAYAALCELDAALARMSDGTYGCCARCRGAIPVERLYMQPVARLCAACRDESLPADGRRS
jgi:DnaK suppressor protein